MLLVARRESCDNGRLLRFGDHAGADLERGGGGGGEAAEFLGQCPRMVHEPLRTYEFQTTKRSEKHCICKTSTCISRDLRDPDFKLFPGDLPSLRMLTRLL